VPEKRDQHCCSSSSVQVEAKRSKAYIFIEKFYAVTTAGAAIDINDVLHYYQFHFVLIFKLKAELVGFAFCCLLHNNDSTDRTTKS